jgi:hypothetical protein
MGQNIFIPNGGGGGGGGASFLTDLVAGNGAQYVDYGFATGGEFFYPDGAFSTIVAFRVVQEDFDAVQIPVITVSDANSNGWSIFISGAKKVCASLDAQIFTPDISDMPLGRVFIAILTYESGGNEANYYLNGRFMVDSNNPPAAVTLPVSFIVGGGGSPTKDFVEYLGFGYIEAELTAEQVCDVYIASQDAAKVVIPASISSETSYVIYNADTGLTNPALWVPEFNTFAAPSLPAIPNGIAAGTVITAPFHVAHSGWASVPPN